MAPARGLQARDSGKLDTRFVLVCICYNWRHISTGLRVYLYDLKDAMMLSMRAESAYIYFI